MLIGNLQIKNSLVLAPLAGITNLPFREICKKQGAGLVCSEMISSNGIVFKSEKTIAMLKSSKNEKPVSIQIFGYDPDIMAEAAQIVIEKSNPDVLDINMGCSVKKILKSGSGSALMKEPEKVKNIIKRVKQVINIPLTVKIRSGWDNTGNQAILISKIAQDNGADAIAVHPRTATQKFSGSADWKLIKKLKSELKIPVIGNGDITSPDDVLDMINKTGCDGVMIGRAAVSNPFIFKKAENLLNNQPAGEIAINEYFEMIRFFLESSVKYFGETKALKMMRSRLGWFVKGLPNNSAFRENIKSLNKKSEALEMITLYKDLLSKKPELKL